MEIRRVHEKRGKPRRKGRDFFSFYGIIDVEGIEE